MSHITYFTRRFKMKEKNFFDDWYRYRLEELNGVYEEISVLKTEKQNDVDKFLEHQKTFKLFNNLVITKDMRELLFSSEISASFRILYENLEEGVFNLLFDVINIFYKRTKLIYGLDGQSKKTTRRALQPYKKTLNDMHKLLNDLFYYDNHHSNPLESLSMLVTITKIEEDLEKIINLSSRKLDNGYLDTGKINQLELQLLNPQRMSEIIKMRKDSQKSYDREKLHDLLEDFQVAITDEIQNSLEAILDKIHS